MNPTYLSDEGKGVPMRKAELVGRADKQGDGGAKTSISWTSITP